MTIRLIQEQRFSSIANNAVAKILLEEELNYQVEVVDIATIRDQAHALITGDASALLEVWPSVTTATFNRYLEADIITYVGPLGVTGQANWYIPAYLREAYPDLFRWEMLSEPEMIELFARTDTSSRGVLMAGDPAQPAYLEDIINNLDLPYQVEYTGSERLLIDEIERTLRNEEPLLVYLRAPHPGLQSFDLVPIRLPSYTEECYALAAIGGVDCGYPSDILFKVVHPALEAEAPDAHTFFRQFFYPSNQDQIQLMQAVANGSTPEAGARAWLRENQHVWTRWLPDNR